MKQTLKQAFEELIEAVEAQQMNPSQHEFVLLLVKEQMEIELQCEEYLMGGTE